MPVTDRMLIGAIAGNPGAFDGAGEYRFCRTCGLIFYTSAKKPNTEHDTHSWFALPSLNPDGSGVLGRAFQRFIKTWDEKRQEELERFAQRKGWDMAMELRYGGGALEDHEASAWQEIVNGRLEQLMRQARRQIDDANAPVPEPPPMT